MMPITMDFAGEIMDSIIGNIIAKIIGIFTGIGQAFCDFNSNLATYDLSQLNKSFTILADVENIFTYAGVGICVTIFIISIAKLMFGPGLDSKDSHFSLIVRFVISMLLIFSFSYIIFKLVMPGCQSILDKISGIDAGTSYETAITNFNILGSNSDDSKTLLDDAAGNLTSFAITGITGTIFGLNGGFVIFLLIFIIFLIAFVVSLFNFTMFCAETYIVMGLSLYFSPLACATFVSKNTESTFKSYVRFVLSKIIVVITNMLSLKLIISATIGVSGAITDPESSDNPFLDLAISFVILIAITKIAKKIGSYVANIMSAAGGGDSASSGFGAIFNGFGSAMRIGHQFGSLAGPGMAGGRKMVDSLTRGKSAQVRNGVGNASNFVKDSIANNDKQSTALANLSESKGVPAFAGTTKGNQPQVSRANKAQGLNGNKPMESKIGNKKDLNSVLDKVNNSNSKSMNLDSKQLHDMLGNENEVGNQLPANANYKIEKVGGTSNSSTYAIKAYGEKFNDGSIKESNAQTVGHIVSSNDGTATVNNFKYDTDVRTSSQGNHFGFGDIANSQKIK